MINEINDGEFFKLGDKCVSKNLYQELFKKEITHNVLLLT